MRRTAREKMKFSGPGLVGIGVRIAAGVLVTLFASANASAQWPERSKSKPKSESKSKQVAPAPSAPVSKPSAPSRLPADPAAPAARGGWSIILEMHSGDGAVARASQRLPFVGQESGRSDVWVRPTERGAAIVAGAYPDPESASARADLEALRSRVIEGQRPYSQAFFAPPIESADPGQIPELNLLTARQSFGQDKQYTLQIGFYQSRKPEEAKRAAERAALQLRRDGELAFYYHGPRMSLVTIGVFGDDDFDQGLRPKNAALIALQDRYPLNLHNGEYPVIEKRPGGQPVKQPSVLVRIPAR